MKKNMLFMIMFLFVILMLSSCIGSFDNNDNKNNQTSFRVVIDPGHGGIDKGATGASGKNEKDYTLSLSIKVQEMLEKKSDIQVFMTRMDDSFISQESRYRPYFANELGADLFISIHGNTFLDPDVSGTETFYYHRGSRSFAKILQKHVAE